MLVQDSKQSDLFRNLLMNRTRSRMALGIMTRRLEPLPTSPTARPEPET